MTKGTKALSRERAKTERCLEIPEFLQTPVSELDIVIICPTCKRKKTRDSGRDNKMTGRRDRLIGSEKNRERQREMGRSMKKCRWEMETAEYSKREVKRHEKR